MSDTPREWCLLEWIYVVGTIGGIILVIIHTATVKP